jgi:hypothetical protein
MEIPDDPLGLNDSAQPTSRIARKETACMLENSDDGADEDDKRDEDADEDGKGKESHKNSGGFFVDTDMVCDIHTISDNFQIIQASELADADVRYSPMRRDVVTARQQQRFWKTQEDFSRARVKRLALLVREMDIICAQTETDIYAKFEDREARFDALVAAAMQEIPKRVQLKMDIKVANAAIDVAARYRCFADLRVQLAELPE